MLPPALTWLNYLFQLIKLSCVFHNIQCYASSTLINLLTVFSCSGDPLIKCLSYRMRVNSSPGTAVVQPPWCPCLSVEGFMLPAALTWLLTDLSLTQTAEGRGQSRGLKRFNICLVSIYIYKKHRKNCEKLPWEWSVVKVLRCDKTWKLKFWRRKKPN